MTFLREYWPILLLWAIICGAAWSEFRYQERHDDDRNKRRRVDDQK